jgi:hypothetical protein
MAGERTEEKGMSGAKQKRAFENGSTRSKLDLRFDLIPKSAVEALARRLTLGAELHGENNWRKGGPAFYQNTKNHLMDHVMNFLETGNQEDLDAIFANAAFLTEYKKLGRDKASDVTGGGA